MNIRDFSEVVELDRDAIIDSRFPILMQFEVPSGDVSFALYANGSATGEYDRSAPTLNLIRASLRTERAIATQ